MDHDKTKAQLFAELAELRQRVSALDAQVARSQQAQADQQQINDSLPLLVATAGLDGYYKKVNAAFERILGWSQQESLSRPFMEFIHPDDHAAALETFGQIKSGKAAIDFVDRNICKDGSHRWINWTVIPLPDRSIVFGIGQDITEKKLADEGRQQAEEALRESDQRLSLHFQRTPLGAIEWDAEFRVTRWNPGAERIFGYSPEEALGRHASFVVPPSVREHVDRIWNGLLARKSGERSTNENVTKDGRTILCDWYNTSLVDVDGQVIGVASLVEDITERIRAEEALQKAHDQLEDKVSERTAELAIFHKFAEAAGQGFGMADMDGVITYVNPALCRILGAENPEDAIGTHLTTYYPEGYSLRRETEIIPALLQEDYWEGEVVVSSGERTMTVLQDSFLIRDGNGNPSRLASVITDITRRKQAEDALRASEDKYKTLVETSPDGVIMTDPKGHITFASQRSLEMHGVQHMEEVLGSSSLDFVAQEDHPRLLANIERTVEEGITRDIEYSFRRKDGTYFAGEVSAAVIKDTSGKPNALVAIVRDITERKQAEEAIRELSERLTLATRAAGVGIWDLDVPNNKLVWDHAMFQLYGITPDDFAGAYEAWQAGVHPEDLPQAEAEVQTALRGEEEFDTEFRAVWPDKSVHWIKAKAMVQHDAFGKPVRMLGTNWDVTERKQAEAALRESEDRYRAVVEDQTEIINRFKADGTLVFVNEVFCRFFGKTSQELVGSKWQPVAFPGDVPMVEEQLRAMSPSNPVVVIENRVYSGLGQIHWMQFVNRGFFNQEGRLIEVQSVGRDITERKRAREALERERQSLWDMLQASDHERQIISYDIHDGLAQYLAAAGMQLQAFGRLRNSDSEQAEKAFDAAIQLVSESHREARRLISEVRPPVIDEVGLETAISHLIHEQRRRGGPRIEFRGNVQFHRLTSVLENALYRILQEALSNAYKHSESKEVTVTLVQEGQEVRLEVRDWGIGFDQDSVGKGHFGLEGIRQRVRLLGGRLNIESKPGSGTLVQVTVPIVERPVEG